jgi:MoxR-like ATPase
MTPDLISHELRLHGYVARRPEALALAALHDQPCGARVALIEGSPGVGKTWLAQCYAAAIGARYIYTLLHSWSDDQELFAGVDIVAAVAGDSARVHRPGVIAIAAEASQHGHAVLCLDEIDKAPERVEGLLLDVLQTGRVPVRPGQHLQARLDHLTVILTSNGERPLGDALLRRCRRVRMQPLTVDEQDRIVGATIDAPAGVVKIAGKAARAIAQAEGNAALSVQELVHLVRDVWSIAESIEDVRELLAQHAARTDKGAQAARSAGARDVAGLWGEVVAARRCAQAPRLALIDRVAGAA